MRIIETTSPDLAGLSPYKTLRRPMEHHRQGIFVAEGKKVVRRLLDSRLEVLSVLLTSEWLEEIRPLLERTPADVYVAPKPLVETIVGFPLHQGLMAVGRIPTQHTLSDVLKNVSPPHLVAAVDGLANSENLGVLVRNCAAFGACALLVGETSSSPFLRRAVRNSMGAVFTLPIIHVERLAQTIETLRTQHGIPVLAAHPHADHVLSEWDMKSQTGVCVVFGSEGEGVSAEVLKACDQAVGVSMDGGVDSLNVASASAIFLFELRKKLR